MTRARTRREPSRRTPAADVPPSKRANGTKGSTTPTSAPGGLPVEGVATASVRCAIYTRKSTDEGLDQDFNSLDAQREAAEAFIASQRHAGWTALPAQYDDGGYSGGTIERPALQRLLADVEHGRVDCIVVYKVDRLSRSLLDFARIIETLDRHGVSFVSVTQQFNTTSSLGRLTLNILLSFAQFNLDADGSALPNALIDRSSSYDDVDNLLATRIEIDATDANDLITRYAYDRNDQLAATAQPEGNRTFHVYDERRLSYKTFYGIAPSTSGTIEQDYPTDKTATTLGTAAFVGFTRTTYDARYNVIQSRDGRGNLIDSHFDFYNRTIATSDQNGNGSVTEYDDASNVLTTEGGAVSKATGQITEVLERTYTRYDEVGRAYQTVRDIDLATDERTALDPESAPQNSSYDAVFDPGSRVIESRDANDNPTSTTYDAANRTLTVTDALGNVATTTYDLNSNVTSVTELELPGPGATGAPEPYVTSFAYDQLNRRTESHILGLNGNSIDHETFLSYDSRHNTRLTIDAEGRATLAAFDDLDRLTQTSRFDRDPAQPGATELLRYTYVYDDNSRKTEDRALADVTDATTIQITRYAYDDLDRLVRTVYPDADDPVTGTPTDNGPDATYDRVETTYDENSNVTSVKDQREVVFTNTYDPGNRLTTQVIALPPTVPGETRREYDYDSLNRLTSAANNYARNTRTYDAFSRLTRETQEIRLDGTGFTTGWQAPIHVESGYDRQSNRIACDVLDPAQPDPDVACDHTFDALNRQQNIDARFFNAPIATRPIATYAYLGPWRVESKTYGNGAKLTNVYDVKRRIAEHRWNSGVDAGGALLVGFAYDYDDVDNPLFEKFLHDGNRFDNYSYNARYELTGVDYRAAAAVDYRSLPVADPKLGPAGAANVYAYDDNFNRKTAAFTDPFANAPATNDAYQINDANEYTQVTRDAVAQNPQHDRAGNMTSFPTVPAIGASAGSTVSATAQWDAFNRLFTGVHKILVGLMRRGFAGEECSGGCSGALVGG